MFWVSGSDRGVAHSPDELFVGGDGLQVLPLSGSAVVLESPISSQPDPCESSPQPFQYESSASFGSGLDVSEVVAICVDASRVFASSSHPFELSSAQLLVKPSSQPFESSAYQPFQIESSLPTGFEALAPLSSSQPDSDVVKVSSVEMVNVSAVADSSSSVPMADIFCCTYFDLSGYGGKRMPYHRFVVTSRFCCSVSRICLLRRDSSWVGSGFPRVVIVASFGSSMPFIFGTRKFACLPRISPI